MLDIFGPWTSLEDISADDLRIATLPSPLVSATDILDWNFEWKDQCLPFETLDALRTQHGIDVTGLNTSLTAKGNLYRAYALARGPLR